MNRYINTVTYPIFEEKYMVLYKKTIYFKFFPSQMLIFPPPRRSFYCFNSNKKHFEKILLFTSNTAIPLVYFCDFFLENEKYSKNQSSFLQFSNGSSFLNFQFLKILKIYSCSVQKELSIDTKISYTLIFAFLPFPASCVIQETEQYNTKPI